jgi:hypothetical protein
MNNFWLGVLYIVSRSYIEVVRLLTLLKKEEGKLVILSAQAGCCRHKALAERQHVIIRPVKDVRFMLVLDKAGLSVLVTSL